MIVRMFLRGLFVLALGLLSIPAYGQQATPSTPQPATLSGTITDDTGGVLPHAMVVITDSGTHTSQEVTASDQGTFIVTPLRPSIAYRLAVSMDGFGAWSSQDITLAPGESRSLGTIAL